jgi:hypothetical protein
MRPGRAIMRGRKPRKLLGISVGGGGICALQKYRLRFGQIGLFEASN